MNKVFSWVLIKCRSKSKFSKNPGIGAGSAQDFRHFEHLYRRFNKKFRCCIFLAKKSVRRGAKYAGDLTCFSSRNLLPHKPAQTATGCLPCAEIPFLQIFKKSYISKIKHPEKLSTL